MRIDWLLLSSLLLCCPLFAQETEVAIDASDDVARARPVDAPETTEDAGVRDLGTFVVSGAQPGPGLWKVHRGAHVLYILGTVSPLPRGMEWQSREVAAVLEEAGAVLGPPGVSLGGNIGMLRGLTLLPSAMRAANNPGRQTLEEVLPPDVYARWALLKARHLGRDRGVERKRPMFAAMELYEGATKRAGLGGGVVAPVIDSALKRRRMKATSTTLPLSIEDPRAALADFRAETLKPEDVDCFSRTMDIVEHDLPEMVARANAWATGDVAALRAMPLESPYRACLQAWSSSEVARKRGIVDVEQRVRARWLEVVDTALAEHATVFATVSIAELLRPGGYLDALAARGDVVESP